MKVLVTGSRGYVGSVLVPLLRKNGLDVKELDTGFFSGKEFLPTDYAAYERKDIREINASDLKGIDSVVHLAGLSNDPAGNLNAELTDEINRAATVRLAELAKKSGAERMIFASSCSIYGVNKGLADELSEFAPLTPYARSKVQAEKELHSLADRNFSPIYLRSGTVYGPSPRMRFDLVLNDFAAMAHLYKKIKLNSDGSASRPMVNINDLARAYHHLLVLPRTLTHNQAFNLAQTNDTVINLANKVSELYKNCKVVSGDKGIDVRDYKVSTKKIVDHGFKYEWPLMRGLLDLQETFRKVDLNEGAYENRHYWTLKQLQYLREEGIIDSQFRINLGGGIDGHLKSWVRE